MQALEVEMPQQKALRPAGSGDGHLGMAGGRVRWSDEVDEVVRGDLTAAADLTPPGGAVVTGIVPLGTGRQPRVLGFATSLGFPGKLERIIADPRVALAFPAREHGFSASPVLVLAQGRARVGLRPWRDRLEALIPQAERYCGQAVRGPVRDRQLHEYFSERVFVDVTVERILTWPDLSAAGPVQVTGALSAPPGGSPRFGTACWPAGGLTDSRWCSRWTSPGTMVSACGWWPWAGCCRLAAAARACSRKKLLLVSNGLFAKYRMWQARRRGAVERLEQLAVGGGPSQRLRSVGISHVISLPDKPRAGLVGLGVAVCACVALVAGCGSASTSALSSGRLPTASQTSTASSLPADPGYQAARQQWIAEGSVISGAEQNVPLGIAVTDLEHGEVTDTGNISGYPAAIAAIENFETLPLTGSTPAQRARAAADLTKIDRFFRVPVLTACGVASGAAGRAAAAAWDTEPRGISSGIAVGPLRRALADLAQQVRTHPAGTSCYPAATADLRNLESATRADIAASAVETTGRGYNLYGAEIAYLNYFFNALDGFNGGQAVLTY